MRGTTKLSNLIWSMKVIFKILCVKIYGVQFYFETSIWPYTGKYGQRNPYYRIYYAVFETMIGPINPNSYIHWLNEKLLPDVYSEPSQTSKMKLFVKLRSWHSELFLKIGVTKE